MLERKGNLFLFLVHVQNVDLEFLVDLDHVSGVLNAIPGHVRDVQQAIDAAQVDERAELGDVLDDALAGLARLDGREQFALQAGAVFFQQLAAGNDDVASNLVDLEDHALDFAVDVIADVRWPRISTWLAGRNTLTPMLTSSPPLILRVTRPLTRSPSLCLARIAFPFLLPLRFAVGEGNDAVLIFDGFEQNLNRVADLRISGRIDAFFLPLVDPDDAFGLVPDVDHHVVAADFTDLASHDLVRLEDGIVLTDPRRDFFLEVSLEVGLEVANV